MPSLPSSASSSLGTAGRPIVRVAAMVIFASAGIAPILPAQGMLGGLKKRAEDAVAQKAAQKVNQKIDEAAQKLVDRSFDSMFGGGGNGSGGGGGGARFGGFSLLPNAPAEPFYDFDAALVYEIESMPKGKPSDEKVLVTMLLNSEGKYAGTRLAPEKPEKGDGDLVAIFDIKNESMVMLMSSDKEKASIAYGWKDARQYAASAAEPANGGTGAAPIVTSPSTPAMTFTSLGKRTIAGYSAEGYRGENEGGDVEVWVTRDAGLPSGRLLGPSASMRQMRGVMPGSYPAGVLLEVLSTDRKSGDKGRMTIKSVDTKSKLRIDMSEYPRVGKENK